MSEETKINTPKSETSSNVRPMPELERYIFEADPYTSGAVPRKLEASEVAKFLIEKIKKDTPLKSLLRVEDVARFYETAEANEHFKTFLDKKESGEEDVRRSAVIVRIIGYSANAEDIKFAAQYYKYLVGRADSADEFEELIVAHATLGLGESSTELSQKLQTKALALSAKKDSDYQARVEYQKYSEDLAQKIFRASRVQSIKEKILNIGDRKKRMDEEIKAYLSLEYGFLEYLQPWATGRLRRETWAIQPAEQIKRTDNAKLQEDVAQAFRNFLDKIKEIKEIEREDEDSIRLRLLRAVKFFGGKISDDEESFLKNFKGKQLDILANEGFGLNE